MVRYAGGPERRTAGSPDGMDRLGEYSLLYDFYGQLLTEKQRQIYEEVRFGDLSLSEASELFGVSRQGIHDTVRRVEEALDRYEEKLGLVREFREVKEKAARIREICGQFSREPRMAEAVGEILQLTMEIENGI